MNHLNCEFKFAAGDAGTMEFVGYGAAFNNQDAQGDVILPGAFTKCLADIKTGSQQWPKMLLQHGMIDILGEGQMPIGVWQDLSEDHAGLKVSGKLAETTRGREVYTLMKMQPRPAIDGLSIGYIAKEVEHRSRPDDPRRRLKRIDLVEISPVTFPANSLAKISGVKALDEISEREFELFLRRAGYSSKTAKTVIASGFRALEKDSSGDYLDLYDAIQNSIKQLSAPTRH